MQDGYVVKELSSTRDAVPVNKSDKAALEKSKEAINAGYEHLKVTYSGDLPNLLPPQKTILKWSDEEKVGSPTYVVDVAQATLEMVTDYGLINRGLTPKCLTPYGIYYLVNEKVWNSMINDLADELESIPGAVTNIKNEEFYDILIVEVNDKIFKFTPPAEDSTKIKVTCKSDNSKTETDIIDPSMLVEYVLRKM